VSHGPIAIHPFIDVAAIENSKTEIFVSDAANNVVNIYNTSGKADRQGNGCMNPERWQQIRDLLEQALELAPEQRAALLDRSCVSDPSLRQEVEVLLAAQRRCALQLFAILYCTGDNAHADHFVSQFAQHPAHAWRMHPRL
jgi:phage gp37-like protein